jgi:hypothetical protein
MLNCKILVKKIKIFFYFLFFVNITTTMAGGGVIQIVATGQQDVYLTQSPVLTFFKGVYRRHTNFAIESIENTFNGNPAFGQKVSAVIARSGDLVHKVYLRVELPSIAGTAVAYVDAVGHSLIKDVTLTIGGTQVDKHYGEWLSVWNELTLPESKHSKYLELIGQRPSLTTTGSAVTGEVIYVPMEFWFNRNAGLALPLIALAYHEVKLEFTFRTLAEITVGTLSSSPSLPGASLYVDYVFLDAEERKNFAQSPHEYLIEQLQFTGSEAVSGSSYKSRLSFNHPVRELVWGIRRTANTSAKDWTNFQGASGTDTFSTAKLQLNGNDRFSERDAMTFNMIQPYQSHTRIPGKGIYVYSFSLKPEQMQPSGSLNFSRIDNATLMLNSPTAGDLFVFAVNHQIFRVMSGMGGVAYNS